MRLFLVKCSLGYELPAQVLHLLREASLDCVDLLAHDRSPYPVQLVQDLRHARLSHLPSERLLYFLDLPHRFSRNPFVLQVRTVQTLR